MTANAIEETINQTAIAANKETSSLSAHYTISTHKFLMPTA